MNRIESFNQALAVFTRALDYLQRSKKPGADVEELKKEWAEATLSSLGITTHISGEVSHEAPLIFVGNHLSYLDIPLLMLTVPKVSFVAKSEIQRWPVIGYGARTVGTIFVKREDGARRASAKAAITEELKRGGRVGLFPAGTTCMKESKPWRRGAFEIAKALDIPIQPFRIRYSPLRPAAYIDDDIFPVHLYKLARVGKVTASVEFAPPFLVGDVVDSSEQWQAWASEGLTGSPEAVNSACKTRSNQPHTSDRAAKKTSNSSPPLA